MIRRVDMVCPVETCGHSLLDIFLEFGAPCACPTCGTEMIRLWVGAQSSAAIIGDECDVTVRHGLCHEDGTPRRFTSKEEMKRVAAAKGLVNHVEHITSRGSDKSPHTTRWI
jgi:hypothetical protein